MEASCLVIQSVSRFQGPLPLCPRLLCPGGAWVEGWGGDRCTGAGEPGPVRSSPPKTVFPGARGTKETVFLLETFATADATARTVLAGQTVQTTRVGAAHLEARGTKLRLEPLPAQDSIFISVVLGILLYIHGSVWFG